jgi:hypothetical protein
MGGTQRGVNRDTSGIASVDVIHKGFQPKVATLFASAAAAGSMIAETPQHRTDHLTVTAAAGQYNAFSIAVHIDTENDGAVPVGAEEFTIVFSKQFIQLVISKEVLTAGEKQEMHQEPGKEADNKCCSLYEYWMTYAFFYHG